MIACSPNYTITINEFLEKIKIDVRTRGYDMVRSTKNLWIETYFIGKVSNTIIEDTKFERMVQGMASNCTRMIIPRREDNLKFVCETWNLGILLQHRATRPNVKLLF